MLFDLIFTILLSDGSSINLTYKEKFHTVEQCESDGMIIAKYFEKYFKSEFPSTGYDGNCIYSVSKKA